MADDGIVWDVEQQYNDVWGSDDEDCEEEFESDMTTQFKQMVETMRTSYDMQRAREHAWMTQVTGSVSWTYGMTTAEDDEKLRMVLNTRANKAKQKYMKSITEDLLLFGYETSHNGLLTYQGNDNSVSNLRWIDEKTLVSMDGSNSDECSILYRFGEDKKAVWYPTALDPSLYAHFYTTYYWTEMQETTAKRKASCEAKRQKKRKREEAEKSLSISDTVRQAQKKLHLNDRLEALKQRMANAKGAATS